MEEIPNIVMQCPKCGKHFPFDHTYCETCSAMLEPLEAPKEKSVPPTDNLRNDDRGSDVTHENIEDKRIDSLRADIERRFAYALLQEMDLLKVRLAEKEKSLAGMKEDKGGAGYGEMVTAAGKTETAMNEIMKKITKLEMMLESLERKLSDDISALDTERKRLGRTGLFNLMNDRGRYFRMLSSELRSKKRVLDVIQGKRPGTALRSMGILRPATLVPSIAAASALLALIIYAYVSNLPHTQPVFHSKAAKADHVLISERDINRVLDDIRTANLKKDQALWKSRYSRSYLASREKKENIAEQWEKVDFMSLAYKVEDIQSSPSGASATIIWEIDFSPRKSMTIKKITQRLRADFAIEDGRVKITSVTKQEP